MIKEYVINQQDRVILMDQIKHERFHTQLYTTKIEEYELTLGEIIDLVRAEIKQMKEANKRRGFKIRYILWPISLLTHISDKIRLNEFPLVPTSSSTLDMLIQQRDQLETRFAQLQEICDYMQNYANFINEKVLYDVRNTKSHCEKINTNLQNKYRDFITFSRNGDYKGGDLWVDIEADYNYLVQQLDVFLSGDQESFFNKFNYIDYLIQGRKVPYLGKNMNFGKKRITFGQG